MTLAFESGAFMESEEARPLRMLAEYFDPKRRFEEAGVRGAVVFFGSSRIRENGPGAAYYAAARELARRVAEWQMQAPKEERLIVCTGGGPGIMEAANRGAADAGAPSAGLGIDLPVEEPLNPYSDRRLAMKFRYFFMRKWWLLHLARAVVAFPGGFGTMDELFEALSLTNTRKTPRCAPPILYGSEFWKKAVDFQAMTELGTVSQREADKIRCVDRPEEALKAIQEALRQGEA